MAQLFFFSDRTGPGPVWVAFPLNEAALEMSSPPRAVTPSVWGEHARGAVFLVPCKSEGEGQPVWVLIAGWEREVAVNGIPLKTGLRVLADRDEIRLGGQEPMYFSAESLATVTIFAGAERPVYCGRCRQELRAGDACVRCPRCGVYYHQTEEFPCWTYAERCAFCPQPTALDTGLAWTPEERP